MSIKGALNDFKSDSTQSISDLTSKSEIKSSSEDNDTVVDKVE